MAGIEYYNIAGRQVGSHHLAMAILGGIFGGIGYASSRPSKAGANPAPPIKAASSDEEDFIKKFIEEQEKLDKKK